MQAIIFIIFILHSFVWTPMCITAFTDKVCLGELVPQFNRSKTLQHLLSTLKTLTKHNFNSAVLTLAGSVMSLHYNTIITMYGGFPIALAIGPTETGKSTAIKAGLVYLEWQNIFT